MTLKTTSQNAKEIELNQINVIFVHGIYLLTFTEKIRGIGEGRNLPYPLLGGHSLNYVKFGA